MSDLQANRFLSSRLPQPTDRRLVVVTGARQVGKTTLVKARYPDLRYLSLDAAEEREAMRSMPSHSWAREVGPAILDEAQKEPSVFEKVKLAYDAGDLDFTVLLGSAQILMLQQVRETLAGRVFLYELWPLTMEELRARGGEPRPPLLARLLGTPDVAAVLTDQPPRRLAEEEAVSLAALAHLGTWGGMPEILRLNDDDRRMWLSSYQRTYLERDLADLARLHDLEPFTRFQKLAALRSGCLLTYAELARDAGVSPSTARNYLEYLRISYQAFLLQPYHRNLTSAAIKTPKLYWVDIGLARQLSGLRDRLTGELFETLVVSEAVKLIKTLGLEVETWFYRTRAGMEVDLVLETTHGILALEAKNRAGSASTDFRGLRALADGLGEQFLGGIVVTSAGAIERDPVDHRLWTVPCHRLFA